MRSDLTGQAVNKFDYIREKHAKVDRETRREVVLGILVKVHGFKMGYGTKTVQNEGHGT